MSRAPTSVRVLRLEGHPFFLGSYPFGPSLCPGPIRASTKSSYVLFVKVRQLVTSGKGSHGLQSSNIDTFAQTRQFESIARRADGPNSPSTFRRRSVKGGQVIDGEGPAAGHCSRIAPMLSGRCLTLRWKGWRAAIRVCRSVSVAISRICLSSRPVVAVAARWGVRGQSRGRR